MKRNYISPELLLTSAHAEDIITTSAGTEYVPTKPSVIKQAYGEADFFEFPG